MVQSEFVFPDADTAYFNTIEGFIRKRVELEQQTISGLRTILKSAPTLPDRKLSWHCALEKLIEGTRHAVELVIRMEELKALKSRMQAVTASIAGARECINTLNSEFRRLNLEGGHSCARHAQATSGSYKDWRYTESADVSLYSLVSLSRAHRDKKKMEVKEVRIRVACEKYHMEDLIYRRTIHKHQESRKAFLNSLPHRTQGYGTKYQTVVSDLSMLMKSLADYLRVPEMYQALAILLDRHSGQHATISNLLLTQTATLRLLSSPWSESTRAMGQTILFGCPLELQADGKLPPVLEYLFESFPTNPHPQVFSNFSDSWFLVNEVELAWTGVQESDRAFISKYDLQSHHRLLSAYFHALPDQVFSPRDIVEVQDKTFLSASKIWDSWSQDPVKAAVARAVLSCESRVNYLAFCSDMTVALSQGHLNASRLLGLFNGLTRYPEIWRPRMSKFEEETR